MSVRVGTLLNPQLQGVIAPQVLYNHNLQIETSFDSQGYVFSIPSPFSVDWGYPDPSAGDDVKITVTTQNEGMQFFNMLINGMYMPPKTSMKCSGTFFGPAFNGGFMDVSFSSGVVTFVSTVSSISRVSMAPALPVIPGLILKSIGTDLPLVFNITVTTTTADGMTSYSQMYPNINTVRFSEVQLNNPGCNGFSYYITPPPSIYPQEETINFDVPLNNLSATATGIVEGNIVMTVEVPLPMGGVETYASNLILNPVMLSGGRIQPGVKLNPSSTFLGSLRANARVSGIVYFCYMMNSSIATLRLSFTTPLAEIPLDSVWPLIATKLTGNVNLTFTPST